MVNVLKHIYLRWFGVAATALVSSVMLEIEPSRAGCSVRRLSPKVQKRYQNQRTHNTAMQETGKGKAT